MKLDTLRALIALTLPTCAAAVPAFAQAPRPLSSGIAFDSSLAPSAAHRFSLRLAKGESANVVVRQIGVDVVLEVRAPDGSLFTTEDSPNGRTGDEPVEILAPASGTYVLLVRPYDASEPAGRYRLEVTALRNTRATARLLDARRLARDSAAAWFRPLSSALAATGVVPPDGSIPPLDGIAARVRVLGLGEATHGSREFGDFRLSVTKRLIQHGNYRIVAIEASESRLALLDRFVGGEAVPSAEVTKAIESGWIGRRSQRELVAWLREWNAGRPPADRVRLVGLDPQDNRTARESLGKFLETAYGAGAPALVYRGARDGGLQFRRTGSDYPLARLVHGGQSPARPRAGPVPGEGGLLGS
jgi:erythromycin esterase